MCSEQDKFIPNQAISAELESNSSENKLLVPVALPSDDVEIITTFFKALSNPTRFNIVYALLQNQQLSVSDISQLTKMSMSAVSHQLAILRMHKLVKVTHEGIKSYYSLCDDHVVKVIEMAIEHIHE